MKRALPLLVLLAGLAASSVLYAQVNFLNARLKVDSNFNLLTATGTAGTVPQTATNIANSRIKTDSNGNLLVVLGASTVPFQSADGTCAAPGITFGNELTTGWFRNGAGDVIYCQGSTPTFRMVANNVFVGANTNLGFTSANADGTPEHYFSRRVGGILATGSSTAMEFSTVQTTVPACGANCGSPGNVVAGTDTAGLITMGTTPASGFVVTFNGTWPSAPSCIVNSALATMVAGKAPIVVATTTTTFTVTTNGTAPVAGDLYSYICIGKS